MFLDFNKNLDKTSELTSKIGTFMICTVYMVFSFFINYVRPEFYDQGRWMPSTINMTFLILSLWLPKSIFNRKYHLFVLIGIFCFLTHFMYLLKVNHFEMNYTTSYMLFITCCILVMSHYYQVAIFSIVSYIMCLYVRDNITWMIKSGYEMWMVTTIIITAFSTCVKIKLINQKNDALEKQKESQDKIIGTSKMKLLGEMAGGLGHEINNPLMIISTQLQMIEISKDKQDITPILEIIDAQVMRIGKITNTLKEFTDTENPVKFYFSLNETIDKVIKIMESKFSQEGVTVTFKNNFSAQVFAKENEISQIIGNLLSNAVDAVKGKENKEITISMTAEKNLITLNVIDNGEGVRKEIKSKIFDPFFTTKDPNKGMGVGLSISKQLALKNEATLYLNEAYEGERTCFTLLIPQNKQAA